MLRERTQKHFFKYPACRLLLLRASVLLPFGATHHPCGLIKWGHEECINADSQRIIPAPNNDRPRRLPPAANLLLLPLFQEHGEAPTTTNFL